ncbi:Modification methylase HhaI [Sodalis glossinidius str. 'morsitans']|uniref:Modification methylase HhaI n=1 Tax=Sodalis glossinidius (strain morsitans) TaxID=343509 RepID=A0A193QHC8_SODGM|nr:DNA cytosine methyltransferase [Sodalis glossinidius]CRL44538.1 Modification methylase HhaI [Sodalis glossinidius str. 'morsitans']
MSAYYNEIDPYAAQWLRNLIVAGHIAEGDVDERSIEDVKPDDLKSYTQCHFFAGMGVWSYALRHAGWPDNKPVWTGSCTCQPFSAAGKGKGFADERHLWPAFFHLIQQCKPGVIFGEQVASPDGLSWLDLVQTDLEAAGYTTAALDLCAAGFGAPHIRQRLYWVADAHCAGLEGWQGMQCSDQIPARTFGMADGLGNTQYNGYLTDEKSESISQLEEERRLCQSERSDTRNSVLQISLPTNSFWRNADWLFCRDEKWRPVEPGACPLADGITSRVGRLRAYGNAIVPQVASAFITAFLETTYALENSSCYRFATDLNVRSNPVLPDTVL